MADHFSVRDLEFITFQNPEAVKKRSTQRVIRSHGVRKAIQERRRKIARQLENFRHTTPQQIEKTALIRSRAAASPPSPTVVIGIQEIDPFSTLVVDDTKLYALVGHGALDL